MGLYILGAPAEQEGEGNIDEADEDGWVQNGLPHGR